MIRLLLLSLLITTAAACSSDSENSPANRPDKQAALMADSVKASFVHAWQGYKEYAWGHDDLQPVSQSPRDWYGESLLMTPVDAYDTMLLMDLDEEAAEAKELIFSELSFDKDLSVQNFEITIRLLGGLLSAYQLDGDKRFLDLAEDLGDRLLPVFSSATGMPYVNVNLQTGDVSGRVNNPAETGTLMLEFGTLSKLTGRPEFYEAAKKAVTEVYERRSEIGLVGTTINVETGEWVNTSSHISGMIDSYYEYLLKSYLLFGDKDFKEMYDNSIRAVNTYLLDREHEGVWYGHADMNTGERTATQYGALDAFMPGVLVLGEEPELAAEIQESNFRMWQLHGIEPEQMNYAEMEVLHGGYALRPENIESAFYLYRETGDQKYRDMAREMYQSIEKYCKTPAGYTELRDVRTMKQGDFMHSFFLAETLKYSYLIFRDDLIPLDTYVFNTEAHPLKRTW